MIYKEDLKLIIPKNRLGLNFTFRLHRFSYRDLLRLFVLKLLGKPLEYTVPNALLDEGEKNILDVYFRNTNVPTSFFIGLGNNGGVPGIPAETATLANITEVSGTGYARQEVGRNTIDWSIPELDAGDYQITAKTVGFTNTGTTNWTAADYAFLTNAASGTAGLLLAAVALSTSRVIEPNQKLEIILKPKAQ